MSLADSIKDIAPCGQHSFNTPHMRSVFCLQTKTPRAANTGDAELLKINTSANSLNILFLKKFITLCIKYYFVLKL